jgi:hypothetical protein
LSKGDEETSHADPPDAGNPATLTTEGGRQMSADAPPPGETEVSGDASRRRLPLVPLRDDVVFPKLIVPLSVGRRTSIAGITSAMDRDKQVLLVAQKDPQVDDTVDTDLYPIGTIAEINGMRQPACSEPESSSSSSTSHSSKSRSR